MFDVTKEFPFNLASKAFDWKTVNYDKFYKFIEDKKIFTSDERKIINFVYREKLPYEIVAAIMNKNPITIKTIDSSIIDKIESAESIILNGSTIADDSINCSEIYQLKNEIGLLRQQLSLSKSLVQAMKTRLEDKSDNEFLEHMEIKIEDLGLSMRVYNALKRIPINSLAELSMYTCRELMEMRNIGRTSVTEIELKLKHYGLELKP